MYTDSTLQPIDDNAPYNSIEDGIKYCRKRPKDTIPGLFKVIEVPRPVDTDTEIVTDFIIDETYTQIWQTRPKTVEELQNDIDGHNAKVDAELLLADLKIIRALVDEDTARINAHKLAQDSRRAMKKNQGE